MKVVTQKTSKSSLQLTRQLVKVEKLKVNLLLILIAQTGA